MRDRVSLAALDVLNKLGPPAIYVDANLYLLITSRAVSLSLKGGNSDGSCPAYVRFGMIAGGRFEDRPAAFRFGQLGCELAERPGLKRFEARTYHMFGAHVAHWTRHVRVGQDWLRRAFDVANHSGDLIFVAYSYSNLNANLLAAGDPLNEVQSEAESGLAFAEKMRFGIIIDIIATQLALIRTLRGLTPVFGCFDIEQFSELQIERRYSETRRLPSIECRYWIRKQQARFLAGDYDAAIDAWSHARRLLETPLSQIDTAEYHLYGALSHAAACGTAPDKRQHTEALAAHHRQIQAWASHCPENFENQASLVGAEIAPLEGRDNDAMHLYEQAIRSAAANGFIHHEAIAYELAAHFYAARGFVEIAHLYLRNARRGFLRWGADGKVRQLEELFPHLKVEGSAFAPTSTIGTRVEHFDLATVIKVSQAVSGEIILEQLIDTLLRMAIEQAGAQRGLLLILEGNELRVEAEAATNGDTVTVHLRDEAVTAMTLPESVLHYVLRTKESLILDDAAVERPFAADRYVQQRKAHSILCVPLLNRATLVGALYLENNLAARVFPPARLALLKLLAAQAAIALENARLYRDLAEREAKIRRLVEANIIGIHISNRDGEIMEANDAFLKMVGYTRDDLITGQIRWTALTPPEWLGGAADASEQLRLTGAAQPYQTEYLRKDGGRVPVLIGVAAFDERRDQRVTFVLDLTGRERAEAKAREMEKDLAHANRVATMGQLTASIAHEVNQPIAATVTNAHAALRWLNAQTPNLGEVREALTCIVGDGRRAGDVIARVRDLITNTPPRKDSVDVNRAIREVIELTRGETTKCGVSVQTMLTDGLPLIACDRVQLQQVVLNLVVNAVQAMSSVSDAPRELLVVTDRTEEGEVLVAVRDSGPGLDTTKVERVFAPFYTTKRGGLGMGLSICRTIVEAHGGQLWATANEPRGAVFRFTMPAHSSRLFSAG